MKVPDDIHGYVWLDITDDAVQLPSSLRNSQSIDIQALAISLPEYEDSVVDDYPQYLFDFRDAMHTRLDNRYISCICICLIH